MKKNLTLKTAMQLLIIAVFAITSCRKSELVTNVSTDVNMTSYLDAHPEEFSELSRILRISGTASFLNAYGGYTLFAPNNKAISTYLSKKGKANVEDLDKDEWRNFIRFHLLEDSIPTSSFKDGKLSQLTMYGQYIVTGSENVGGVTNIKVNRQANIITPNISVGNGLIHAIDNVLEPATLTIAQTLESTPGYSIFIEALKATGLYNMLNILPSENADEKTKWLTLIAETDDVLAQAGINNFLDLKDKYSNTGDVTLATDSLNLFLKYHILYDAKYLADIVTSTAHTTLAPLEVLTAKLSGETVLINDDSFNGVHEPGFELLRSVSDVSSTNGVIHKAGTHFNIKVRRPYRVDFDVCTFPEMVKNTAYYQKANYFFTPAEVASLSEIKFSHGMEDQRFIYRYGSGQSTSKTSYNYDVLVVPLGPNGASNRPKWVDFKTPLLVKGKYKVWIGYYRQQETSSGGGSNAIVQASIGSENSNERALLANSRTLSFDAKRPGQAADVEEAIGWKIYTEPNSGSQVARLMGVADIPQTGRYWLRLEAVAGGPNGANGQRTNNIDLIQFIPISDDQQYPRFDIYGTAIPRP